MIHKNLNVKIHFLLSYTKDINKKLFLFSNDKFFLIDILTIQLKIVNAITYSNIWLLPSTHMVIYILKRQI